jgi:hypothetical protein
VPAVCAALRRLRGVAVLGLAAALSIAACGRRHERTGAPSRGPACLTGSDDRCGATTTTTAPASTCGADLSRDPRHCGGCGHDCLGGACVDGACAPVVVARGQEAAQLALGPGFVAWTNPARGGEIVRAPRGGGALVKLASGLAIGSFALAPGRVLFTQGGASTEDVRSMPVDGGSAVTLLAGARVAGSIAADMAAVYVPVRAAPWAVVRVPLEGGPPARAWSSEATGAGGGAPDATRTLPSSVAIAAGHLVVAVEGTYLEGGGSRRDGFVVAIPPGEGAPVRLAANLVRPRLATTDGVRAWFAAGEDDASSAVLVAPLDGSSPAATLTRTAATGLCVDDSSVLWSDADGLTRLDFATGVRARLAPDANGPVAADATAIAWTAPDGAGATAVVLLAK